MVGQSQGCTPTAYRRRSPADTPLYRAVQNHLETFLALCRDDWEDVRIARHAERELRRYLECAILAYGIGAIRRGAFAALGRRGFRLGGQCFIGDGRG